MIVLKWAVATFQSTRNVKNISYILLFGNSGSWWSWLVIYTIHISLSTGVPGFQATLLPKQLFPVSLPNFHSVRWSRTPSPKKTCGKEEPWHFRKASELPKNLLEIYMFFFQPKKYTPPKGFKKQLGCLPWNENPGHLKRPQEPNSTQPLNPLGRKTSAASNYENGQLQLHQVGFVFPVVKIRFGTCENHMLLQLHVLQFWKFTCFKICE